MADDTTAVQVEAAVEQANVEPTGAEPGQQTEHGKTFTQAELDAIVAERLQRAQRKAEEATKKATEAAQAQALKEQGEYQKLFEQAQAKLQEAEQRARALEIAGIRRDVAARLNLPAGLVSRLQGETEDEITADAKDLLAALPKPPAPDINAGASSAKGKPSLIDGMDIDTLAARLGVNAKVAREYLNGGS